MCTPQFADASTVPRCLCDNEHLFPISLPTCLENSRKVSPVPQRIAQHIMKQIDS